MALRLSVLDQSPVPEGYTAGVSLRNSIDLARLADCLGYFRYWVAEHHGSKSLASASPEALIGPIAMETSNLRVGSGGVMLQHYSPLKVAETFGVLSGLFPARIDLGIGRAAGTSPRVAFALRRDKRQPAPDDFREQLNELLRYTEGDPEITLLGSSPDSVVLAAELSLPYVFADFINPNGAGIVRASRMLLPRVSIACWAICAETDEEAFRLSLPFRMMSIMTSRGRTKPVPTVERAEQFLKEAGMPLEELPPGRRIITGTPQHVRAAIEAVAADYTAEEVFVVNIMHDHLARRRSYELIAKAFK
jgi:luciferase family oxidoreductase group 1